MAAARVGHSAQRVQHGVQVGRDHQAQVLVIVTGIDDDAQLSRAYPAQPVGELGAADLSGQSDH